MATVEQPITRTVLKEELEHYATKADLSREIGSAVRWIVMLHLGSIVALAAIASAIVAAVKLIG